MQFSDPPKLRSKHVPATWDEVSSLVDDWTDVLPSDPWTSAAIAVAVAAHDPLKDEADD